MCKEEGESVDHLFVHCPFSKEICEETLNLYVGKGKWEGKAFLECLDQWRKDILVRNHKALPYI